VAVALGAVYETFVVGFLIGAAFHFVSPTMLAVGFVVGAIV